MYSRFETAGRSGHIEFEFIFKLIFFWLLSSRARHATNALFNLTMNWWGHFWYRIRFDAMAKKTEFDYLMIFVTYFIIHEIHSFWSESSKFFFATRLHGNLITKIFYVRRHWHIRYNVWQEVGYAWFFTVLSFHMYNDKNSITVHRAYIFMIIIQSVYFFIFISSSNLFYVWFVAQVTQTE